MVFGGAPAPRPLIATRVGGIPEIFGPTANGLVPPGDAAALGAAMQRFMDNAPAAEAESLQRLEYVHRHFSAERMVSAIETLYRQVLAGVAAR